jgi:hypothetical protein
MFFIVKEKELIVGNKILSRNLTVTTLTWRN